jgi:acyl-CoA synthetase (AMP-forming)/AMP-acid ligase II
MDFNLADLFESVADAVPDREALVCGERRLSFRELDERATRLAHVLLDRGVEPGDHVGLYLYNGSEYLEATLAAYKIRAVPINVNYRYVEEELRYLFDDADLVAVIHHREFGPRLAKIRADLPRLRTYLCVNETTGADGSGIEDDYETLLAAASARRDFGPRSPDDLYILYTGGTTGMPKGVMWRQEDIFFGALFGGDPMGSPIERPEGIVEKATQGEPITSFPIAPLMHGAAQWAALIALYGGNRVVLSTGRRFDPSEVWRTVERERVTIVAIVGDAMARPLSDALAEPGSSYDLSSLIVIGSGGAMWSESVKARLHEQLPKVMLLDSFGSSETGAHGRGSGSEAGGPRFVMNESTTVFDESLEPVKPGSGEVGRLAQRGRIPLGYYGDAEKTARTFVEVDGVRWVLPGDMATPEDDGTIRLLGRGSVCINSGGEKIFPEEVEAALKSHPDVFDAVVVGVPDERFGERVAAVVQARASRPLTLESVGQHCRGRVAGYKVPRELHLVEQMVRQPSGKPDYRWARRVAEGSPS